MTDCLTVAEVLAMDTDQIERYGGSHGVREPDCWKPPSTARRPVITPAPIQEAAALRASLAQNHAFIDANKRTDFAAMYTFLAINGARLTADAQEIYAFVAGSTKPTSSTWRQVCAVAVKSLDRGAVMNILSSTVGKAYRKPASAGTAQKRCLAASK
jgi:death-on-curing protein